MTKALAKMGLTVNPLQTPLYMTLKGGEAEEIISALSNLQNARDAWKFYVDQGYLITIVR